MMFRFVDYMSDISPLPRYKVFVRCGDVNEKVSKGSGAVVYRGKAPDAEVNVTMPP